MNEKKKEPERKLKPEDYEIYRDTNRRDALSASKEVQDL